MFKIDIKSYFWNKYWKWYHMRLFRPQKFMSVVIRTTLSGITARSITLFTPTFWYFYTDIYAKSVTFCNSVISYWLMRGESIMSERRSRKCSQVLLGVAAGQTPCQLLLWHTSLSAGQGNSTQVKESKMSGTEERDRATTLIRKHWKVNLSINSFEKDTFSN